MTQGHEVNVIIALRTVNDPPSRVRSWETYHVIRNNSANHPGADADRHDTGMATQPRLGLRSQQRARIGSADTADTRTDGPDIARRSMQRLLYYVWNFIEKGRK